MRARKYRIYGTFPGTWNLAPGSKSVTVRATGGAIPEYFSRKYHQALLYSSGFTCPENTSHRHLSIVNPNGRNATFSIAFAIRESISPEAGGPFPVHPIPFKN